MANTRRKAAWVLTAAMAVLPAATARAAQDDPLTRRVRTATPVIAALIQRATEQSPTFHGMIDRISESDDYVFIMDGRCPHSERACFTAVTMADSHRMLWVNIDTNKHDADWVTMGSIGHELRHAIEVIEEPSVRSTAEKWFFYTRAGFHTNTGSFETEAALETGENVRDEVRRFMKTHDR